MLLPMAVLAFFCAALGLLPRIALSLIVRDSRIESDAVASLDVLREGMGAALRRSIVNSEGAVGSLVDPALEVSEAGVTFWKRAWRRRKSVSTSSALKWPNFSSG